MNSSQTKSEVVTNKGDVNLEKLTDGGFCGGESFSHEGDNGSRNLDGDLNRRGKRFAEGECGESSERQDDFAKGFTVGGRDGLKRGKP